MLTQSDLDALTARLAPLLRGPGLDDHLTECHRVLERIAVEGCSACAMLAAEVLCRQGAEGWSERRVP